MTGSTLKLSEPEKLRKLKEDLPHEFQFRRDMAYAIYIDAVNKKASEATIKYMKELVEFYDGI